MISSTANLIGFILQHPLTRNHRVKAFTRVAAWQLRSRLQQEVIYSWIGGQRLAVTRGMTGATGNIYAGLHEFPDMMFLLHLLRPKDLFLDIGANVGTYTVLASGVCRANTWAFEPDQQAAARLRRNIEINKLQELVSVHEAVLGESEREVYFTLGFDTTNRVASDRESSRVVSQLMLNSFLSGSDMMPTFAKIDVEGYEENVVLGGTNLFCGGVLKAIALETVTEKLRVMLVRHGFSRFFYDPFTRFLAKEPTGIQSSNALFIRDVDFVRQRIEQSPRIRVLGYSV